MFSSPSKECIQRLQREYRRMTKEPNPHFYAVPDPKTITTWHFLLTGPEDTPYAGGRYLGRLRFPNDYPFKPPRISMSTPSGRFSPDADICLSNSSYHPEKWNPVWGVDSIITGLLSFLVADEPAAGTVVTSVEVRQRLAKESRLYNTRNLAVLFRRVMPDIYEQEVSAVEEAARIEAEAHNISSPAASSATVEKEEDGSEDSAKADAAHTSAEERTSPTNSRSMRRLLQPAPDLPVVMSFHRCWPLAACFMVAAAAMLLSVFLH